MNPQQNKLKALVLSGVVYTALTMMASASALVSWELKTVNEEGDVLSAYNSNTDPSVPTSFATTAAGVSVTNITTTGVNTQLNNGNGFLLVTNSTAVTTRDDLIAAGLTNKYTSFTLSATSGNLLTLESLDYSSYRSSTLSGSPNKGVWGYRIDGGEWTLSPEIGLVAAAATGNPIALSNWDFADFSTTGTVEFAFWGYGATSGAPNSSRSVGVVAVSTIGGAGLVVNGEVNAVPEPSTCLMLLGGLAFAGWQMQRRRTPVQ